MSQNVWRAAATLLCILQLTQAATVYFYVNGTIDNSLTYDVDENTTEPITCGALDTNKTTAVVSHGFNGTCLTQNIDKLSQAFLADGTKNVACLDWRKEAQAGPLFVYEFYPKAASEGQEAGEAFGRFIANLVKSGLDPAKCDFYGHSMGAHVMARAAYTVYKLTGQYIRNLMGLDAAGPLYENPQLYPRINKSCAATVTLLHTDPGKLGMEKSEGHLDFFVNPQEHEKNGVQPGCQCRPLIGGPLAKTATCSHKLSVLILIDEILNKKSSQQMLAIKADSEDDFEASNTAGNYIIPFDEEPNATVPGNYYFRTNAASPYALGIEGTKPAKPESRCSAFQLF